MPEEWLQKLIDATKQNDQGAAEAFVKSEHIKSVLQASGGEYFERLLAALKKYFTEYDEGLEGDRTASSTTFTLRAQGALKDRYTVVRDRFPAISAVLSFNGKQIALDNTIAHKEDRFELIVGANDALSAREMYGQNASLYDSPTDLARDMMQKLFKKPETSAS